MFFARRPFGYGGVDLDREQQFQMVGATHDERLERLGYAQAWPDGRKPFDCRHCAGKFLTEAARDAHGQKRHAPTRTASPFDDDEALEREERALNERAPLYLDKTAASRS